MRPDPADASQEATAAEGQEDIEPLSPDEIEAIRKRLSSLGYL